LQVPENKGFFHVLIKITEFATVDFSEKFFKETVGKDMIVAVQTAKNIEYFIDERPLLESKLITKHLETFVSLCLIRG
jgi:hypothetical protein